MRTDSIYKNEEFNMNYIIKKLPEYLESENKKDYEWDEEQNLEEPIGEYKEYTFYIDKEYVAHIEDKEKNQIPLEGLKNRWNLGIENSDFEVKGSPEYRGKDEGVYLNNTMLKTKENYPLTIPYTMILENKNITVSASNAEACLFGMGKLLPNTFNWLGVSIRGWANTWDAYSGNINSYFTYANTEQNYSKNEWHIFAIRDDGENFAYFLDGKKLNSCRSNKYVPESPLFIGGCNESGQSNAGCYTQYANGYYRNLAIYDVALTDEQIQNYSF